MIVIRHSLKKTHLMSIKKHTFPQFPCQECEKKFDSSWSLAKHMNNKHYGEYKCFVCDIVITGKTWKEKNIQRKESLEKIMYILKILKQM